jgi:6-phosphogluconolactonase
MSTVSMRRGVRPTLALLALLASAPLAFPGGAGEGPGRVFAMTNAKAGNDVVMYLRDEDGSLKLQGNFPTGGTGIGEPLGSQSSLVLTRDSRWLLAVSAGSDELSSFRMTAAGPMLVDVIPTSGAMPTSVAVQDDLVYVMHAAAPNILRGFHLGAGGELSPIAGSERPLSGPNTMPAQVGFNPAGNLLLVTERATNLLTFFQVFDDGTLGPPRPQPSIGSTPFGFAFRSVDQLIVSEAFANVPNGSAVSSYKIASFAPITPSVPTLQSAACWIVITKNRRFAYSTNTGSDTITGFSIDPLGNLTKLDANGVTAVAGDAPIDAALSANSAYLYVLNEMDGTISVFSVAEDGSLAPNSTATGLPPFSAGLAAF